ncbi:MAG: tRNA (guanine(46)-N(7))-methyltransferase TrmB [Simkaniaceae bacterium]|nr:tRNA (guanine(46)-N(7))-methyltransferase TrmB [Simkaniaceae bacterium]
MRPKDLKFPFSWEKRHPLISKGVLYVPEYYKNHDQFLMPPFEDASLFGNDQKVFIEFCSGNGEWIFNKALENPKINWIAVEMQFKRVRKIFSKRENAGLSNLFIVAGEALTFMRSYLKDDSCHAAYVNFPDPWPKDRHAKHRLIRESFALELGRILAPFGTAEFVTDDLTYAKQMMGVMAKLPIWSNVEKLPFDNYGTSFFERLWRQKGRVINHLKYSNQKNVN